jgi:hypothetical protein
MTTDITALAERLKEQAEFGDVDEEFSTDLDAAAAALLVRRGISPRQE